MAYSARGGRYKELYPYLRFGFVVGNKRAIGNKFFMHSRNFDFALAMPDEDMRPLLDVVGWQLKLASAMLEIIVKRPVLSWEQGSLPHWGCVPIAMMTNRQPTMPGCVACASPERIFGAIFRCPLNAR